MVIKKICNEGGIPHFRIGSGRLVKIRPAKAAKTTKKPPPAIKAEEDFSSAIALVETSILPIAQTSDFRLGRWEATPFCNRKVLVLSKTTVLDTTGLAIVTRKENRKILAKKVHISRKRVVSTMLSIKHTKGIGHTSRL
jgi:hypothetical protein